MIIFRKARSSRQTLNDLDAYLRQTGNEPAEWLAREVQKWGEFSYSDLEAAILDGHLNDLIDWQARYAKVVNGTLAPMWATAMAAAAKKATKEKVILDDSDVFVKAWIQTHGGELITRLSEESRRAVAAIILRGQAERILPRDMAKQIRPLIGLTEMQAQANVNYREKIYRSYLEGGTSSTVAAARADKAAVKYASQQHRFRAETIVHTELAFAYNRGAHMGVSQAVSDRLMGRCEMVWSTAGTNRVCSRCLALKDTVVGHTDESGVTLPPLHPRCRCAIMYREIEAPKPQRVLRQFKDATEANDYFGNDKTDTSKPFGAWVSSIPDSWAKAIKTYTSYFYEEMNDWLRGLKADSEFTSSEIKILKQTILDCELALQLGNLPNDILVHREVGRNMLDLYKNAPNRIFHDEGFTSTSPVKGTHFGSVDVEIVVPAGKGAGMWIAPISRYKSENEFLLNRGTKFKVLSIDESSSRPLVKLEVIGRDPKEVIKMLTKHTDEENRVEKTDDKRRAKKFTWEPADVKVQDENGKWIRGDEFLRRLKQTTPEKME